MIAGTPLAVRRWGRARQPLPASVEKRAGEAPAGAYATKKWVNASFDNLVKAFGKGMAEYAKKKIAPLQQEVEQQGRVNEALGRQVDKILAELAELKREGALQKRLDDARNQRRIESLETALLAAGRRPDQDTETEIPKMEWNGHAQQ